MKVISGNKLEVIVQAFPDIWESTVLDVGCRDKKLRDILLAENYRVQYVGMDNDPEVDPEIVLNIRYLSHYCYCRRYHTVAALDVLEHTEDMYAAFSGVCRCAKKYVVISLPNLYQIKYRWQFLTGSLKSKKYGLPTIESPGDRHRWLFNLHEAGKFMFFQSSICGFRIADELLIVGRRLRPFTFLARWWPSLFARHYVVLLERRF